MTTKTIKVTATEKEILNSCKAAKASGLEIADGGWYIKWDGGQNKWTSEGSCCPLAAVILANQPTPSPAQLESLGRDGDDVHDVCCALAADILKKDREWASDFTSSFDEPDNCDTGPAARAGNKLRSVFIKDEVDDDDCEE